MTDPITRREFAGLVAAGSVISAATDARSAEDTAKQTAKTAASPVELLVDLVRDKYPDDRLDDAAVEEIRSDFRHFVARSKLLSGFPLTNADEPGFAFAAWRADRKAN